MMYHLKPKDKQLLKQKGFTLIPFYVFLYPRYHTFDDAINKYGYQSGGRFFFYVSVLSSTKTGNSYYPSNMKKYYQQPHIMDVCYQLAMYYNEHGDARITNNTYIDLYSTGCDARQSIRSYHSYLVWAVKQLCCQYLVDDIVHTMLLWM